MRFCDFEDESRIVPLTQGLVRCHVNRSFSFWTANGNRQIGFSRCTVNVRISGDKKSFCDRRTQGFNHRRMHLGSGQSIFVNAGRFHCAKYDQDDWANKDYEQHRDAEAAKWHEPFPISPPPVGFWRRRNYRRCLVHRAFLLRRRSSAQPISSLRSELDSFSFRHAGCPP